MSSPSTDRRRGPLTAVLAVVVLAGVLALGWAVVAASRDGGPAIPSPSTSAPSTAGASSDASPVPSLPILTTPATRPTIAASPVR